MERPSVRDVAEATAEFHERLNSMGVYVALCVGVTKENMAAEKAVITKFNVTSSGGDLDAIVPLIAAVGCEFKRLVKYAYEAHSCNLMASGEKAISEKDFSEMVGRMVEELASTEFGAKPKGDIAL